MTVSSFRARAAWALLFTVACGAGLEGQLQQSSVTAIVTDAARRPLSAALVTLADPLGAAIQTLRTGSTGRAVFSAVAPGRYELRVGVDPVFSLPVTVVGALPMEITLRVPDAVTDRVVVEGTADETSSRSSIGGETIARIPTRVRRRALQDVLATLPGWSTEDNGLLHARGVDDGFLYVIDGVPVYERLDAVSGIAPDVLSVGSINVITGYVPPEFGHKAGGVIEVRSTAAQSWTAIADVFGGSDNARDASVLAGGRVGQSVSIRAGIAVGATDRYLDPVHPDNLHNDGRQSNTFGQFEWTTSPVSRVSGGWGYGQSTFDVPNNEEQHEAGQHQRQRLGQGSFQTTWQRTWSSRLVTQTAAYHRRTSSRLEGSEFDTPLEAHANRLLRRSGLLFALTQQHGNHLLKTGFEWQRLSIDEAFSFAITDDAEAEEAGFREQALQFARQSPFRFAGRATPTLFSLYLQDAWQAAPNLTVSGGVRFDRSGLLLRRRQWSPRIGAALRVSDVTLLRASVSRFFQPPQPENILLSSSPEARVLSSITVDDAEGGADIEPERQWGTEIGVEHRIGRVRLDGAYWARRAVNVSDPNVFAGTTIIFPNAVARGRAHGVEMRVELPEQRGWSGYANWSAARVIQTGPINGGLFLEDEVEEIGPGVEFSPDHDQRFTAGGAVTWEHRRSGAAVSFTARYETGTPVQQDEDDFEGLLTQPGAEMVDFDAGRVKPRTVASMLLTTPVLNTDKITASAGVQVLNIFNAGYAFNFGNPFSGTHFGAPRTFGVNLRLTFR